jgi:hypothetical protein
VVELEVVVVVVLVLSVDWLLLFVSLNVDYRVVKLIKQKITQSIFL